MASLRRPSRWVVAKTSKKVLAKRNRGAPVTVPAHRTAQLLQASEAVKALQAPQAVQASQALQDSRATVRGHSRLPLSCLSALEGGVCRRPVLSACDRVCPILQMVLRAFDEWCLHLQVIVWRSLDWAR